MVQVIWEGGLRIDYLDSLAINYFFRTKYMYPKLITVIIPVYNTEQYLTTCLDSLLQQTFQDFEVILIDEVLKIRREKFVMNIHLVFQR